MAHSTRPTLPPLHTLGLPRGDIPRPRNRELYELKEPSGPTRQLRLPPTQLFSHQPYQPPVSSSMAPHNPPVPTLWVTPHTSTAASASAPAPASAPRTTPPFPTRKICLTPTSFENADAVVVISPPAAPNTSPPQSLFLVGPALQHLRRGERQLERGARVLSYRVARGSPDRRTLTAQSDTNA